MEQLTLKPITSRSITTKKKPRYFRCKNKIKSRDGKGTRTFESINLAKKESRKLQIETDGGLGRGCLVVVARLPRRIR